MKIDATLSPPLDLDLLVGYLARTASGLPKYARLRDALLAAIEGGHLAPGAKLPAEQDLARATPFSLGTVQRALRALADERIVVRHQGSGTYVAESRRPMDAPWHCRFLADDGRSFLPIYPKVLARRKIRGTGPWSHYIGSRSGNVICIERAINVGDEFRVYSRFYLDGGRFGGMLTRPIAELDGANFKQILSREFGLLVTHLTQSLRTIPFPDEICRAVGVGKGTTGTLLEVAASTGRSRYVYYQELFIPPNRRRLMVSDTYDETTR